MKQMNATSHEIALPKWTDCPPATTALEGPLGGAETVTTGISDLPLALERADQIIGGESKGAAFGQGALGDVRQAIHFLDARLSAQVGHEGSLASPARQRSVLLELGIRAVDGVRVDREIGGDFSHGRQLVSGAKRTGGYGVQDLLPQLQVDGDPA